MTAGLQDPRTASVDISKLRAHVSAPPSWQDPLLCFTTDVLPPLPEIRDAAIAEQVFRHRTAVPNAPTHVSRTKGSYEPLEAMGDRVLNYEVYRYLEEQRPDATPGLLGDYTSYLVGNRTLSYLSLAYGLPDRIVHSAGMDLSLNQKVAADLFEAYVGGMYRDRGLDAVKPWLDSLFSLATWPALSGLIDAGIARLDRKSLTEERVRETSPNHSSGQICAGCAEPLDNFTRPTVHLEAFTNSRLRWHAAIILDTKVISCGFGLTKREAEADARDRIYRRVL